jgi:endonuclease-3
VAEKALANLRGSFFDWNEVRVSTVRELGETLCALPDPTAAAARVKGILQAVFESDYSFELEHLKKQNIGAAVKRLQKFPGTTPFGLAYATQTALGGHAIPLDQGSLGALVVIGVASPEEAASGSVSGLERAIPKSKGREFAALLHELGADFFANPFSPTLRELLLSIAPDSKDRFPKRTSKKPRVEPEPPPAPPQGPAADKKKAKPALAGKEVAGKEPAAKEATAKSKEKRTAPAAKTTTRPKKKVAGKPKKAGAKTLTKRKPR